MSGTLGTSLGDLMERYLDGEPRAFRELYEILRPRLRRQMSTFVSEASALDDLVQQVFMHAHLKRDTFRWPEGDRGRAVFAWYSAIARNRAIDALRRRGRKDARTASIGDGSVMEARGFAKETVCGQEEVMLEQEAAELTVQRVRHAIEKLPPSQREVVELHKLRGMSMDEIAEQTGVRAGTLRVRAHRAYHSLAYLLSGLGGPNATGLAARG